VTSSPPWCRRPKIKVSMSLYRWIWWCRSCRLIFKSRHGENDSILPPRRRRWEEEINPQYQKNWHGETITLKTRLKLIKNDKSPLPWRESAAAEMLRTRSCRVGRPREEGAKRYAASVLCFRLVRLLGQAWQTFVDNRQTWATPTCNGESPRF
jgi:rubredoxin